MQQSAAQTRPDSAIARLKQALEALPSSSRMSRDDTEAVYAMAYNLVVQGQYDLASGYLSLLTLYSPTNTKYLTGLALTYKLLKQYDSALNVYLFVAALEPEQPQHTLSLAECLMLQGDAHRAQSALSLVMRFCADHKQFERVGVRARAMSDLMGGTRVGDDDTA